MIDLIKNKLGDRLVHIEQEKYNNEYVDSYIVQVKFEDGIEIIEIYFNESWHYTFGCGHVFYSNSLNELLNKLIEYDYFDELYTVMFDKYYKPYLI